MNNNDQGNSLKTPETPSANLIGHYNIFEVEDSRSLSYDQHIQNVSWFLI